MSKNDAMTEKSSKRFDTLERKIGSISSHGEVLTMTPKPPFKNYLKIDWVIEHEEFEYCLYFYRCGDFSESVIEKEVTENSVSPIPLYTGDGATWSIKITRNNSNATSANVNPSTPHINAISGFRFGTNPTSDSITINAVESDDKGRGKGQGS